MRGNIHTIYTNIRACLAYLRTYMQALHTSTCLHANMNLHYPREYVHTRHTHVNSWHAFARYTRMPHTCKCTYTHYRYIHIYITHIHTLHDMHYIFAHIHTLQYMQTAETHTCIHHTHTHACIHTCMHAITNTYKHHIHTHECLVYVCVFYDEYVEVCGCTPQWIIERRCNACHAHSCHSKRSSRVVSDEHC